MLGPPFVGPQPWLRVAETFDEILRTIAEAQISPRQCLRDAISGYETVNTVVCVQVTGRGFERDGSRDHLGRRTESAMSNLIMLLKN